MRTLFLLIAAGLVLAACGDETAATTTSVPSTTAGRQWEPAEPVGDTQDPQPVPIVAVLDISGTTLRLGFETGVPPCYVLDSVEVEERPEEVRVTIFVGTTDPEAVCIEIAEARSVTVELSEPLGDRAIVDGSTGRPVG